MGAALAFSLFVTACIDGTLHGDPQTVCHEFQIRSYPTLAECESARKATVDDWMAGLAWLSPHLAGERCGPAEPEGDGDDI
jgi:hypothetical protein